MERKWKKPPPEASPFAEFISLKKNVTGRATTPTCMAGLWTRRALPDRNTPFLDEFLENYRRLGAKIRDLSRRLNDRLARAQGIVARCPGY